MKCAGMVLLLCLASPLAQAQGELYRIEGEKPGARFGNALAAVGDLDGDGLDDLAIGARYDDTMGGAAGRVEIRSGRDGSRLRTWYGQKTGDFFGTEVACAGDADGDGINDVAVSAEDEIWLFSGRNGKRLWRVHWPGAHGSRYALLAAAGDVNLDGHDDLLFGYPFRDGIHENEGLVGVRSGRTGEMLWKARGERNDYLGIALVEAGDVDGDGELDVAVGAPGPGNRPGQIRFFRGRDGRFLFAVSGPPDGDGCGYVLDFGADIDGDGVGDWLTGCYLSYTIQAFSGATFEPIARFEDRLSIGRTVAGVPDVDGDGHDEVLAGSVAAREARLYSGRTGEVLRAWTGDPLEGFPEKLVVTPKINEGGIADLIFSSPGEASHVIGSVSIWSSACGPSSRYGSGCPGAGGVVPELTVGGCAVPKGTGSVDIRSGRGFAVGSLIVGLSGRADQPMLGCRLLVAPPHTLFGIVLSGAPGAPGAGEAHVPFRLPNTSALVGRELSVQAMFLDPAASQGVSFTNGAEIRIE